jgi:hypothetical protein
MTFEGLASITTNRAATVNNTCMRFFMLHSPGMKKGSSQSSRTSSLREQIHPLAVVSHFVLTVH